MKSIKQQIIEAKQQKTERNKEAWFVDYCNNCKTGLACESDVPCHHKGQSGCRHLLPSAWPSLL